MGEVHLSHHLDARRRERRTPLPRLRPPSRPSGCVSPMVWVHPRCLPGARLRCSTCTRNASRPHLAGGGARAARVQVHLSWMRDAPVSRPGASLMDERCTRLVFDVHPGGIGDALLLLLLDPITGESSASPAS